MSEVKVNKISPRSGTDVTLGDSGDTFTIPAGATLTNNGTASGFASIAWQSSIVTAATHTAAAGQGLWLDTSSNAITLTLPASPSVGDQIIFTDYARTWAINAVTLNLNSEKFQGNATPVPVYDTNGESVNIVYSGSTKGWIPNTDGATALETPQSYSGDILVVAGGGSNGDANVGSQFSSGGGGAGGYRSFTSETFNGGSLYTITVGAGGTSHANGSNSSISGTGISYTSAGGGAGGDGDNTGANAGNAGGSGGGSGANNVGGLGGSGNTPSTSPSQGNNGGNGTDSGNTGAGGGGGAGAVGGNGSGGPGLGGNGGNGTANSITGSSVTYAGGGGGGAGYGPNGTGGTGGTGGGGNGSGTGVGSNGTANTGGGAGGSEGTTSTAANGGSGVVILRVPTASYSGTTTGSPTVTTDGTDTVIKFTGSGSYIA